MAEFLSCLTSPQMYGLLALVSWRSARVVLTIARVTVESIDSDDDDDNDDDDGIDC